jgi:hypothetical protein
MGLIKKLFTSAEKATKANKDFSGKNKSEIADGLRKGSKQCAKKMADWRWKKNK